MPRSLTNVYTPSMRGALPIALLLALVLEVLGTGCDGIPDRGTYDYQANDVIQDGCGLVSSTGALWTGQLRKSGSYLELPITLHGITLTGYYLTGSNDFSVDGTAGQAPETVNGTRCQLDWIGVHLDGVPQSATVFTGSVRVQYQDIDTEACRCELSATFTATQEP
jgi:hypothetical protein